MIDRDILCKLGKKVYSYTPLIILFSIIFFITCQIGKPIPVVKHKRLFNSTSQLFLRNECSLEEKRIASHFSADTLPGLMQKGLIQRYRRNASGTYIFVNRNLWKDRSEYFKDCLLKEVIVYNKVNNYELSTKIIDNLSGKLYAQISSSAKMDLYD
jgi:hypothetical protein